ncbi:hypothetical protein RB595_007258 [Gaeumannomyces hyphopodioides]
MLVQYWLPLALVIILVRLVGHENTAATWSAINRTISTTLWPLLLQADSVGTDHRSRAIVAISSTMTLCAALLVLAGVVAPLGLRDEIIPGAPQQVRFEYVRDPSPWGKITPVRPDLPFSRHCEFGRRINCPGQYQGVDFVEVAPGNFSSVRRDNSSFVNTTIPLNYTTMFASATGDPGNTLSGMFDVQYRRWTVKFVDLIDDGAPGARGDYRFIELLIPQNDILIKEGLIVDVTDKNPGIGFRNHTVPTGLAFGGTWTEDLTWLEPVTSCADTNLTAEYVTQVVEGSFTPNRTWTLIDRGAFRDLDMTALESPAWGDNQTLDLFGRAHKAARMYNVHAARVLNVSLPLDSSVGTIPKILLTNGSDGSSLDKRFNDLLFSDVDVDNTKLSSLIGLGKTRFSSNSSDSDIRPPANFAPRYPDGLRKLFASNLTAISNICNGLYAVGDSIDRRATNITNPMVQCGFLISAGRAPQSGDDGDTTTPVGDIMKGTTIKRKNFYVCATGIRASIKTVAFRYNGTDTKLSNLHIDSITDKAYPDERSKPLWSVETSGDQRMTFDPLWGIVDDSHSTVESFHSMRAEKLWLPTVVSPGVTFGQRQAFDPLAAVTAPGLNVANLYSDVTRDTAQHTGGQSLPLVERFARLSAKETTAGLIPSLILTDVLASLLVGTKTAVRRTPVGWPARMAVDEPAGGLARANVTAYYRAVSYDLRYAVPSFVLLALLLVVSVWAAVVLLVERCGVIRALRGMYNQTSAGRLAASLLRGGAAGDPNQSSAEWAEGDGRLVLSFGNIGSRRAGYYARIEKDEGGSRLSLYAEDGAQGDEEKKG